MIRATTVTASGMVLIGSMFSLAACAPSVQTGYRPQCLPWNMSDEEFVPFTQEIRRQAMMGDRRAFHDAFLVTYCSDTDRSERMESLLCDLLKNDNKLLLTMLSREPSYIREFVLSMINQDSDNPIALPAEP